MSFIWPGMLWSLLLVPLSVLLYIRLQRRRQKLAASYGRLGFLPGGGRTMGERRHVPPLFFLAGLIALMLALARPQTVVSLPRVEGTVILAFDASGSMAADDMAPTRMDAAKAAARDFIQRQPPAVKVGIVAFSDNGYALQAPTNDQDLLLAAVSRLAPQKGTSLAHGIEASLQAISAGNGQGQLLYSNLSPTPAPTPTPLPRGTYTNAAIVLLSDGENNESPDPLAAAQTAANRGVRIYTIGIGSPAGTTLHIGGFYIHTELNEGLLKQVAQLTGGAYYNATTVQDLQKIYDNLDPQLVVKPVKTEVTSLFAGASILALLAGGAFSLLWFNRMP